MKELLSKFNHDVLEFRIEVIVDFSEKIKKKLPNKLSLDITNIAIASINEVKDKKSKLTNVIHKELKKDEDKVIVSSNDIHEDKENFEKEKDIYKKLKTDEVKERFKNELEGYHMVNKEPLNMSKWETINSKIASIALPISDEACGNHASGKDAKFGDYGMSMKTGKIQGKKVKKASISSYRLTTVCNTANNGTEENIINEIKKRDKSFEYYSILLREEKNNKDYIDYRWYVIPKKFRLFQVKNLKLNANKKNWESQDKNCKITFSLSSQLWFDFNLDEIDDEYMIASHEIYNCESKMDYTDVLKLRDFKRS